MSPRARLAVVASAVALALTPAAPAEARTAACIPGTQAPLCTVWTGRVDFVADADTLDVDVAGDGRRAPVRIRVTGIQAMEQRVYSRYADRRRGDCHALPATARVAALVRAARGRVRLAAHDPASRSGSRVRRAVAVRIGGRWREIGADLLARGHALWLPNPVEYAWNRSYRALAQRAALAGRRLYDDDACRPGPSQDAGLGLEVNWDADGRDDLNLNGEWFDIANPSGRDVPVGGWWVRDSHLRRYTFPAAAVVPARGSVRVHVGPGEERPGRFHWGLTAPAFENAEGGARSLGDGGYLFDPDGDLRAWTIYPGR